MNYIPSLKYQVLKKENLHPDQLNILTKYKSPQTSTTKIFISSLIDINLTILITYFFLETYKSFIAVTLPDQLYRIFFNHLSDYSSYVVFSIAPIVGWTLQFFGLYFFNGTIGMKMVGGIALPNNVEKIYLSPLSCFRFATLSVFTNFFLAFIWNFKPFASLYTGVRLIDAKDYDWAQEIIGQQEVAHFEEFPYKLSSEISALNDQQIHEEEKLVA